MNILYPYQGLQFDRVVQAINLDGTPAAGVFTAESVLGAQVWQGQNQATLFTPTVEWFTKPDSGGNATQTGYDQGQISISIAGEQTSGLDPAGEYLILITETTSDITAPVWEGRVKILATPGSTSSIPPDLITLDYCKSILTDISLTEAQADNLPYLIAAASQQIRKFCFDRNFDSRTYSEVYSVALDGMIRLSQIPVNLIRRVQATPQTALTLQNTSSGNQFSEAYFSYTGQYGAYGSNALTATGLTLSWITNGVLTTQSITFAPNMMILDLANIINSTFGVNGWSARADSVYGLWPVTELDGGFVSQGCSASATPGTGATFYILQDATGAAFAANGQATGFLYVGGLGAAWEAQRWGPGGQGLWSTSVNPGRVKITYDAGNSPIPAQVQFWTAQLCKWFIEVGKQELMLQSETAADYAYTLNNLQVAGMPTTVAQGLSQWRVHYA